MNDFTKDELEELMHCVYTYRDLCDEDVEDNLCDKLKYMIDNYCDHKPSDKINKHFIWQLCSKCGKEYK